MSTISDIYYVKQGEDEYQDFTVKFPGITILKIDSFNEIGAAKNIYVGTWNNSDKEDVSFPDTVYFENVDCNLDFIISDKDNHNINVQSAHDTFISYMLKHQFTIKSLYVNKEAEFICKKGYKPTMERMKRSPGNNVIMGTLQMHRTDVAKNI